MEQLLGAPSIPSDSEEDQANAVFTRKLEISEKMKRFSFEFWHDTSNSGRFQGVCACVVWTKKKIYLPWEYHTYEIIFKVVFDPTIITLFEPDFSIF